MPAISALTDPTVLDFVTGQKLTAVQLESDSGNLRTAIVDLNDVVADLENNYASSSEPTDKPEGKIFCDITSDPAVLKFYKDGSGNLAQVVDQNNFMPSAAWPSFSAHVSSEQAIGSSNPTKVEFDTETFDTNSDFDKDTNFRFTPTVAGKYLLTAFIGLNAGTDADIMNCLLYKNGSRYKGTQIQMAQTNDGISLTDVVDANGSTDYFEIFVDSFGDAAYNVLGADPTSSVASFFAGSRIA